MSDLLLLPGIFLILGSLLVPLVRGRARAVLLLALPLASGCQLWLLDLSGEHLQLSLFDYTLVPLRVDSLSLVFGTVFHIAAFLAVLFALRVKDTVQHVTGLLYAGSAIAAVFAGDLLTLFCYWELTAISSVFLVWAGRTEPAYRAGLRYLVIQVGSGVLLLAGILIHVEATGSVAFGHLGLDAPGGLLILLAFGIKAAFPLLHTWLPDAYPKATPTGTVFLSAFTTKMAVYALARGYAGEEALIAIGAVMAVFPLVYGVLADDLRRVLAYSLNSQLGYMVVGVGVGTQLALNGVAAHAFAHVLYKALLFMSMGAVLARAGTAKASELGGLFRSMPWTACFCMVGAASIAAFPLFSGFVTKSLILSAAAAEHHPWAWHALLFAGAAVMPYLAIRVPYHAFFGRDRGLRVPEAPAHMLLAMGAGAILCVAAGVFPGRVYDLLPYPVHEEAYTAGHVVGQLQLLLFSGLCCLLLKRARVYPAARAGTVLDSDWIYRRALPALIRAGVRAGGRVRDGAVRAARTTLGAGKDVVYRHSGPAGILARTWSTGSTVIWVAVILVVLLFLFYRL